MAKQGKLKNAEIEAIEREIENLRRGGDGPLNPKRLRAKGPPPNWQEYERWLLDKAKRTPKAEAALLEARTSLGIFRQRTARGAGGVIRVPPGERSAGIGATRGAQPYRPSSGGLPASPGSEIVQLGATGKPTGVEKALAGFVSKAGQGGIPSSAAAAAKPTFFGKGGKGKGAIWPLVMMLIGGGIGRATGGGGEPGEGQLPPHLQAQMAIASMQAQGGQQKTNTDMINAMRVINMLKQLQEMAAATQIAPPAGLV